MSSLMFALRHPRFVADHRYTVRQASAFAGGELRERSRRRIEQHAAACPMCAELISGLRRTLSALRALGRPPATAPQASSDQELISEVLDALRVQREAGAGREPPDEAGP